MKPAKRMGKNSLWYLHFLFMSCVPLLSLLGVFQESRSVFASGFSGDPQVVIAVDATKQGPVACQLTLRANIGTPREAGETLPCPARTIMRTMMVPRSQALKQHTPYILLSSLGVSSASQTQNAQQLMRILHTQTSPPRVHPLTTACGNTGSAILTWGANDNSSGDYIILTSAVTFYIPSAPHCNEVVFDTSSMNVDLLSPNCVFEVDRPPCFSWMFDRYAGTEYGLPYDPALIWENHTYSHSINLQNTKGYTYEQVIYDHNDYTGRGEFWSDIPIN